VSFSGLRIEVVMLIISAAVLILQTYHHLKGLQHSFKPTLTFSLGFHCIQRFNDAFQR
jgi:hypothetical protein